MSGPLIAWEGIARTYPGAVPVEALRPSTLQISQGEHLAIVGASGSGKSTMLNVLGLLDAPTEGSYLIGDIDISDLDETSRAAIRASMFGFVFQAFHLISTRTVVENVEIGMLYNRVSRRLRRQRALDALEQVGLGHRLHATASTLSGGERQRVAIARAIANRPQVLLCDEPTGNLDTATTNTVLDLLGQVCSDGITLIVVTHDERVAQRADRRFQVSDGVVAEAIVTGAADAGSTC